MPFGRLGVGLVVASVLFCWVINVKENKLNEAYAQAIKDNYWAVILGTDKIYGQAHESRQTVQVLWYAMVFSGVFGFASLVAGVLSAAVRSRPKGSIASRASGVSAVTEGASGKAESPGYGDLAWGDSPPNEFTPGTVTETDRCVLALVGLDKNHEHLRKMSCPTRGSRVFGIHAKEVAYWFVADCFRGVTAVFDESQYGAIAAAVGGRFGDRSLGRAQQSLACSSNGSTALALRGADGNRPPCIALIDARYANLIPKEPSNLSVFIVALAAILMLMIVLLGLIAIAN